MPQLLKLTLTLTFTSVNCPRPHNFPVSPPGSRSLSRRHGILPARLGGPARHRHQALCTAKMPPRAGWEEACPWPLLCMSPASCSWPRSPRVTSASAPSPTAQPCTHPPCSGGPLAAAHGSGGGVPGAAFPAVQGSLLRLGYLGLSGLSCSAAPGALLLSADTRSRSLPHAAVPAIPPRPLP